ncbi:tetratricopeptide repeat protein [Alkalimonas amylolytica]|uniref:Sel1 repeat-containing protein n=1 Tax=Alkalimonas amylolytica TaxID=152573 RepID=A0A1H4AYU1_ALKAM|nr:sel1 repeat family protein [Alkalimonas amylolytica]SEA40957.1 hypothetical protein SAMN04488051_10385 [Alkalimonas amylolytica]
MTFKTGRQHLAATKKLTLAELEDKLLEHQQLINAIVKDSGILLPSLLQGPAIADAVATWFTAALKSYASKDYPTAAQHFRQAAMLGHAKAQYYLGLMFAKGLGMPASIKHAYCWLLLAAKQRDQSALALVRTLQSKMSADLVQQATELAAERFESIEDRKNALS